MPAPASRVVKLCAVADGDAVLEVGVGSGGQLVALATDTPSGRAVGVDLAVQFLLPE